MKTLWKKEYALRASDFDKFNRIKPSSVLELFQDAAGQHAQELGLGYNSMLKRSYLWVLVRVKYKIFFQTYPYQNVVIKTWPLKPNRLNFRREYCIEDANGNIIIAGTSEWVIIDSEKRHFVSDPDLYPFNDGFHEEKMFEEKLTKIQNLQTDDVPYAVNAGFSDLDINNHVNNTKYTNYVLDAINPSKDDVIESLQIDYRKEVMQETQLNISYTREDNHIIAKGQNKDDEVMFACKIDLYKN